MYKGKTFLAVIPARGGSKGLPDKNIKILCGKPLIMWSTDIAKQSKYIDKIIVSTDSQKIADLAGKAGMSVPFIRPKSLAQDESSTFDVLKHACNFYKKNYNKEYDYIVLLEPTSPLRDVEDVDGAIEKLLASKADAIVGVCKVEAQSPEFLIHKDEDGYICGYENKGMKAIRRQDIEDLYYFEGSIYVSKTEKLLAEETFYHNKTIGFEMPKHKALEIDDIEDFRMIEAILLHRESVFCD
ncbi:MAG: acylneuraminate cytidylyltransferase family protein [Gammaproteobacteria bacterium]|nr:acylneuraminate cytidylyltransferase family protein [Gammaproteobacteria bacterium]MCH9744488.1 acylneuraminate cytidylyltransferase family protein [Gammaproteobacteria bacterium]